MATVAKLGDKDILERLLSVPGWVVHDGKLYREFRFTDFVEAFGFMTKAAMVAHQQDHHPEWFNVYNVVRIHLSTHDVGGISERDFHLAAEISAHFDGANVHGV